MKKLITSLLTLIFALGLFITAPESIHATQEISEEKPINLMKTGDFGDYTVKEISQFEYVHKVAQNEKISLLEAQKKVDSIIKSSESTLARSRGNIVYRDASWTQTYSKNSRYKAKLNATFAIYVAPTSSFRNIESFTSGSHLAAGTSSASWKVSHYDPKPSFPKLSVSLGVTGYFTESRSVSSGASASIPGFSVSSSTSSTIRFVSNNMIIRRTYSVY